MKKQKTSEGYLLIHKGLQTNVIVHADGNVELRPYNWVVETELRNKLKKNRAKTIAETILFAVGIKVEEGK